MSLSRVQSLQRRGHRAARGLARLALLLACALGYLGVASSASGINADPYFWSAGTGPSSPWPVAFSTIGWADSHDGGTAVAVIPGSTDVLYGGFFGNSGTGSPTADFEMADGTTTSLAGPSGGGYQRQFAWFGRRQTNGKWVWVNGWRESGSDEISLAVSGDGAQGYVAGSWRPTNLTSGDDPIAGVSDFAFLGPNTSNVSLPFGLLAAADGFDYGAPQVTGMLAGFDPLTGNIEWARTTDTKRGRNGNFFTDVEVDSSGAAIASAFYLEDMRICAAAFYVGDTTFSCPAGTNEGPDAQHTYICCSGSEGISLIARVSAAGAINWVNGWGGTRPDYQIDARNHRAVGLSVLPDDSVVVVGEHRDALPQKQLPFPGLADTFDTGGTTQGVIAKLSSLGTWEWARLLGGGTVRGVSVIPDGATRTDALVVADNSNAAAAPWAVPQLGGGTLSPSPQGSLIAGRVVVGDAQDPANEGTWAWMNTNSRVSSDGYFAAVDVAASADGSGVFLSMGWNQTRYPSHLFGSHDAFSGLPAGTNRYGVSSVLSTSDPSGAWTWAGAVSPGGSTDDGFADVYASALAVGNNTAYVTGRTVRAVMASLLPGATSPTATPGNGQAVITWPVPSTNGGSAIASYTATVTDTGATCTVNEPTRTCTFSGLTNGTQYAIEVVATNADGGVGQPGTVSVTPRTTPAAPQSVSASYGDGLATVNWSAPSSDGGSAVTEYTATAVGSGRSCQVSAPATTCVISGLTNGTTYVVEVTAANAAGEGNASAQVSVTPKGPPTAPLSPSSAPGNGQTVISWSAPASTEGAAVQSYTATVAGSGESCTVPAPGTTCTITGLTNGATYSVSVTATNSEGTGPASAVTSVTPRTVPDAPTGVTATARTERAVIAWTAPGDNGGNAVTQYTATVSGSGETCTATAPSTTCTITGLTAGQSYSVSVRATNAAGSGAASASASVTPLPVPGPPLNVAATPRDGAALVAWDPPSANGALEPTSYTATVSGSGETCTATAPATSCTISGLTNGTTYSVSVTASNAEATGPSSSAATVTPASPPGAPSISGVSNGDGQVVVNWTAPSSTGGAPLTGYRVEIRDMSQAGYPIVANACTAGASASQCTVTGLTNGTSYQARVYASSSSGESAPSNWYAAYPRGLPGAVTNASATASGVEQLAVSWQAPANDGGDTITRYEVTATASGEPTRLCYATGVPAGTSCTISSLSAGVDYSISIAARNSVGLGPAVATSATAVGRPDRPTMVTASAADQAAVVSWAAPTNTGGAPITQYVATDLGSGQSCTASPPATTCTITGLANGVRADIEVTAANAYATSYGSSMASVTPSGPPSAPTLTRAAPGYKKVQVAWSPPPESVTTYTATASPGGRSCTVAAPTAFCEITGLTNGTTYTVTVVASNGAGSSPQSNSLTATPFSGSSFFDATANGLSAIDVDWNALANTDFGDGGAWTTVTASTDTGATCSASFAAGGCSISGLPSGATYAVSLQAQWSTHPGPMNVPGVEEVTLGTLPDPPTAVSATPLLNSATVSWSPPASSGTAPISSYTATAQPGGQSCAVAAGTTSCTISGLTGGTSYSVSVTATTSVGTGSASSTASVTPLALPGAPTIASVVGGNGTATLTWFAPASDGGSPVTSYTAVVTGGASCTVSAPATSCTITGLTNGITYTAAVSATSALGSGSASVAATVTPRGTVPGAPTSPSANPGAGQATINWTAPASDGGSAITGYTATATASGQTPQTCTAGPSATSCTITGLTNGTQYTVIVTADNVEGTSSASASQVVTPRTVPGTPTSPSANPGAGQATINWTAPASDGGSAITGYTATATASGQTPQTCTAGPSATSCTITGLSAGISYAVSVAAENAAGSSTLSGPAAVVPVAGAPGAPRSPALQVGNRHAVVSWDPPASTGGLPIVRYTATTTPGAMTCTAIAPSTTCMVRNMINGMQYSVRVQAEHAQAMGSPSVPVLGTPATVPDPPEAPQAAAGTGQVVLSWQPPADDGGAAVTSYIVTAGPGGYQCSVNAPATSCTIAGLTAGVEYTFTIVALNGQGQSVASTAVRATPQAAAVIAPVQVALPTLAPPPAVVAPPAPQPDKTGNFLEVAAGDARYIYWNGVVKPTPLVITGTPSKPRMVAGKPSDFSMALQGNEPRAAALDPLSQRLIFNTGKQGLATGRGFKPGTQAEIWLFSDPVFLGYADIRPDGTFSREFLVPPDVPSGNHTIQAEGISKKGTPRAVSAGVLVRKDAARVRTVRLAVAFPPDSAYLAPAYRRALKRVGGSRVLSVRVDGFVHPTPKRAGDTRLSRQRARVAAGVLRAADTRTTRQATKAGIRYAIRARGRRAAAHRGCKQWLNRCAIVTVVRTEPAKAAQKKKKAATTRRTSVAPRAAERVGQLTMPAGPPVPGGR